MTETRRVRRARAPGGRWLSLPLLVTVCTLSGGGTARADSPAVVDSQSIVRSLQPPGGATRGLVVEHRETAAGVHKVILDIRFANNSDRLTGAAHAQLAELGAALSSPELARSRFLIAGYTSASGGAGHNQRLSEARARSVRRYLLERFSIAPERIESAGFGASRPLPQFPPNALEQRRGGVSPLPPAS